MPISENQLKFLLERIGQKYRDRILLAVRYEEEKEIEKAMHEWEDLIAQARKEGKDISVIQQHVQRVHSLLWQKGRPTVRGVNEEAVGPGEREREGEEGGPAGERENQFMELKNTFRQELQNRCILQGVNVSSTTEENRLLIRSILDRIFKDHLRDIPNWVRRRDLLEAIVDEVVGLGVVEAYLKDPEINEVMINGTDVFFEKGGAIHPSPRKFKNVDEVKKVIDRIVQPIGRRVDESSPMVDARLPDGSRVNIVMPPVALDGPVITVRKFNPVGFTDEEMIRNGCYSAAMSAFFRLMVVYRQNVIIAGRSSSGKTTLLNIVAAYIPEGERVVTIEDMAELRLSLRHVVRMEARPPNLQGKGEITIRTLFRNALRMRPDRIIVGECRGAETLDMLQAMNTGHDGAISTAHANSPGDLFSRLEAMVGMGDVPMNDRTVRKQIASGVNIVVYCTRFPDGRRRVASVCEVLGGGTSEEEIQVREIFEFRRHGVDVGGQERMHGGFLSTGYVPTFVSENPELNRDPQVMGLFGRGASDEPAPQVS